MFRVLWEPVLWLLAAIAVLIGVGVDFANIRDLIGRANTLHIQSPPLTFLVILASFDVVVMIAYVCLALGLLSRIWRIVTRRRDITAAMPLYRMLKHLPITGHLNFVYQEREFRVMRIGNDVYRFTPIHQDPRGNVWYRLSARDGYLEGHSPTKTLPVGERSVQLMADAIRRVLGDTIPTNQEHSSGS